MNGKQVGHKRIARRTGNVFSLDEGADVGIDEDTPVTEDYQAGAKSRFTGKIDRVTIDVKEMTPAHKAFVEKAAEEAAEREAAQD